MVAHTLSHHLEAQIDLCEFEANPIYIVSSWTA